MQPKNIMRMHARIYVEEEARVPSKVNGLHWQKKKKKTLPTPTKFF